MTTINGSVCVVNGTPVDKVFSNGKQVYGKKVYGRNLYLNSKSLNYLYGINRSATVELETFDSDTNMWHIVAAQGAGRDVGMFIFKYRDVEVPDGSDWYYSADVKGMGNIYIFGINCGSITPVVGTIGSEWSRISQRGHVVGGDKIVVMYFDATNSPVDVYIKLPELKIGSLATPWTPASFAGERNLINGR